MNDGLSYGNKTKRLFYSLVAQIPKGKVSTYGTLAKTVGIHPRFAGYLLHRNPNPKTIPCHRVVNSKGQVAKGYAFGGAAGQVARLKAEGVVLEREEVDLEQYFWSPR